MVEHGPTAESGKAPCKPPNGIIVAGWSLLWLGDSCSSGWERSWSRVLAR